MISVDEISKIVEKKNRLKKETYTKIYEQVCKKIRQAVDHSNKQVFIEIPSFVIGCPSFDRYKATLYIKRQLDLSGFDTALINNHEILVTWKIKRDKKNKEPETNHEEEEFPTLINLKKAANKYRRNAKNG
jgi:hypothetical protein